MIIEVSRVSIEVVAAGISSPVLGSSEEDLVVQIDRPSGLRSNELGLVALDLRELHPLHALIVEKGQDIERDRGGAGFNPNTVDYLWTADGLSISGVASVVKNYRIWQMQV